MDTGFLEDLANEELLFQQFSLVGTGDISASGSLKAGYAVNINAGADSDSSGGTAGATGACCLPGDSCELVTLGQCFADGGFFQGVGSPCSGTICGTSATCSSGTGACCIAGACRCFTRAGCAYAGGTFRGVGSSCTPSPCGAGAGACEHPDGSCSITSEEDCDGTFHGAGSSCIAGCCFGDGSCVADQPTAVCQAAGGTDQGYGSGCEPNTCTAECPPTTHLCACAPNPGSGCFDPTPICCPDLYEICATFAISGECRCLCCHDTGFGIVCL